MRISDWSSDVCSSDLEEIIPERAREALKERAPENGCLRFAKYESGYHMLLRDLDAEIVRRDIVAWMFHPDEPLPSGADMVADRGGGDRGYALNCRTHKASARRSARSRVRLRSQRSPVTNLWGVPFFEDGWILHH